MGWWGIPTHYEYVARKVCNELHKIRAPPDEKEILIRVAAEEAFKSTIRSDPKLAAVMWKEMKLCYPDIIKGTLLDWKVNGARSGNGGGRSQYSASWGEWKLGLDGGILDFDA